MILVADITLEQPKVFLPLVCAAILLAFAYIIINKTKGNGRITAYSISIFIFLALVITAVRPDSNLLFTYDDGALSVETKDQIITTNATTQQQIIELKNTNSDFRETIKNLNNKLISFEKNYRKKSNADNNATLEKAEKTTDLKTSIKEDLQKLPTQPPAGTPAVDIENTVAKATKIKLTLNSLKSIKLQQKRGDRLYYNLVSYDISSGNSQHLDASDTDNAYSFQEVNSNEIIGDSFEFSIEDIANENFTLRLELVIQWKGSWYKFYSHTFSKEELSKIGSNQKLTAFYESFWRAKEYDLFYSLELAE